MSLIETEVAPTDGVQKVQTEAQVEQPSWFYSAPSEDKDGVPGQGEVPEWFKVDKYKSLEDQAKGYAELEKRFGGFTGSPADGYTLAEDLGDIDTEDPLYQSFSEFAKESNMGNDTFNKMVGMYFSQMEAQTAQQQQAEMEKLGDKAQERITNIKGWINSNLDANMAEKILPMATTADSIEALEHLIGMTKNSNPANPAAAQPTQKMSQSEYAELLMAKDKSGNMKINSDLDYKRRMDELAKQFIA